MMSKIPIYRQIQQSLKERITGGHYSEGSLLPSEFDLCSEFGATRMTVRQALTELVKEGYITRHHGKGSIVSAIRKSLGLLSLKGWTEVVEASKRHGTTEILSGPYVAPQEVRAELAFFDVEESDVDFFYLKRLRRVDGIPIAFEQTFLSATAGLENFCEQTLIDGSVFRTLFMKYEIDVVGMTQEIRAVACNAEHAKLLGVKKNAPILHITRKYQTSKEGFYLYGSIYCNTEKFAVSSFN